jgi:hypothetical protein
MNDETRFPDSMPLAREIVNVGPTPEGCFVLTTFSQGQIDEMLTQPGTSDWLLDNERTELTIMRWDPEPRPLVTFNLARDTHRRALRDALARGTIHICAAESVNMQTGMIDGAKIALDLGLADRVAIEMALRVHN